jgi:hypothetical protein
LGCCREPAFASEEERRAAWLRHREQILLLSAPGRRPQAWWAYEAPVAWPGLGCERSALYAADGILSEAEKLELEAYWHEEFDRAQEEGFWICMAPNEILEGRAARRAHYRDVDIPAALVKKWTAERRRQVQAIRRLEAMAGA